MNGDCGIHIVIDGIEALTLFVAVIRGDNLSAEAIARLRGDAEKITTAGKTIGESAATLDRVSPDPATTT